MIVNIPSSLGELLDKISILIIKKKNIVDEAKKNHILEELLALNKTLDKMIPKTKVEKYIQSLIDINSKLWKIEDEIRECERKKIFDKNFIDLARSVYINNDKRSEIKLEINKKFGSKIVEVKSYKKY